MPNFDPDTNANNINSKTTTNSQPQSKPSNISISPSLDNHSSIDSSIEPQQQQFEQQLDHAFVARHSSQYDDKPKSQLITYNHISYLLYFISYFTAGVLFLIPIMMNYMKRHDAKGTWLATHFDWQIKTFWYSIVFFIIGVLLMFFSVVGVSGSILAESSSIAIGSIGLFSLGLLIIGFTILWHFYRIIRGWIALSDKRPVP